MYHPFWIAFYLKKVEHDQDLRLWQHRSRPRPGVDSQGLESRLVRFRARPDRSLHPFKDCGEQGVRSGGQRRDDHQPDEGLRPAEPDPRLSHPTHRPRPRRQAKVATVDR